jgi:hypothetical protein
MTTAPSGSDEQTCAHESWTPEDDAIIDLLSEGASHQRTADVLGISTKSVQRRVSDTAFAGEVVRRRRQRLTQLAGQFSVASNRAAEVLTDALEADDLKVALRAAGLVLDHGLRHRRSEEEQELAARQDDLEARMEAALAVLNSLAHGGVAG